MLEHRHGAIERIRLDDLKPAERNARTHTKKQLDRLAKSMKTFGTTALVLIDKESRIIAGHARVEAAKKAGLTEVDCRRLDLTSAQARAYAIADNALGEKGSSWDAEILALEMAALTDLDFDVTLTGFDMPEVDALLSDAAEASPKRVGPEDETPALDETGEPITQLGDLWRLGRHTLLCGDAKDPATVERLMAGQHADMVFTDPPYGVPIQGHVSGLGRVRHREFIEGSGEMAPEAFEAFLSQALSNAAAVCRDGAIAYVCMDWRHLREAWAAGAAAFTELKNMCVWSKTNAGMGTFYRSQHELVMVWKVGTAQHTNTFGLGDKGRHRTNVWVYPGVNGFKGGRMEELALHPTCKPVALVADAIRDVSHRGEIVLDLFGGSGTTLIAAEKTGRVARVLELDPLYCDVIVRRWEKLTGKIAERAETPPPTCGWGSPAPGWGQ